MSKRLLDELGGSNFEPRVLSEVLKFKGEEMENLFAMARDKRDDYFPQKKVEVRSVVEISNICDKSCRYCNMGNEKNIKNYSMSSEEIFSIVKDVYEKGRRVVLLQSGENSDQQYIEGVADAVYRIKSQMNDVTIILCLGGLERRFYERLWEAGADKYILKFETSNEGLFSLIKPKEKLRDRLDCLENLIDIGFGVGSGNITGLPGQNIEDIVNDLILLHRYGLTMNSTTTFVPAEKSNYSKEKPGSVELTLKTMALMRIMNPSRLMPTTSSLEKLRKGGQLRGLNAGANTVTIHDGTPSEIKSLFPIYSTERVIPEKEHFVGIVERGNMEL